MLQYIASELEEQQFDDLKARLSIPAPTDGEEDKNKKKVDCIMNVPWNVLKCHLERLGRLDIVDYIHSSTLITEGIVYTNIVERN